MVETASETGKESEAQLKNDLALTPDWSAPSLTSAEAYSTNDRCEPAEEDIDPTSLPGDDVRNPTTAAQVRVEPPQLQNATSQPEQQNNSNVNIQTDDDKSCAMFMPDDRTNPDAPEKRDDVADFGDVIESCSKCAFVFLVVVFK